MSAGRFAPSPSGDLHVGNLRTALLAWLFARSTGRELRMRVDDLDRERTRPEAERRQLADLAALGIDWDGEVVRQSDRIAGYDAALDDLDRRGLVYPCFCTRREIQEAPTAPHHPPGSYPGTCRDLTDAERAARGSDRPAALRLRSDVRTFAVDDVLHGTYEGAVDDFVLRRGDGAVAYNLATVVDDSDLGVDQVVRGDDLLASSPRQAYLATLLGHRPPTFAHVPLVLNPDGQRLAKRDGPVTLPELTARGVDVVGLIGASLGLPGTPAEMLSVFDAGGLSTDPWTFDPLSPK